uniref:Major perivitellin subunit 1 n=1 Tax=Pomacea scalaris TaxID=527798 RepID=A0A2U8SZI5_9CAEN|nr:major perivitellin subunit 1 [Pomacea scalaris]
MFVATSLLLALATLVANVASKDEYLIMEINPPKKVSEHEILNMLSPLEIKHKFRVTGTTKLWIVIKLDPLGYMKLDDITVPGKVSVTPAEDMVDTMEKFGVIWPRVLLTDVNITLFQSHSYLTDVTKDQLTAMMVGYGEHMIETLKSHPYQFYRATGATPHKHFFFVSSAREEVEVIGREGVDIWGGPGEYHIKPEYLTRI